MTLRTIAIYATTILAANTSCVTVQFNLASNVNNVTVVKQQAGSEGAAVEMAGSNVEDLVKDSGQTNKTEATVPLR